MWSNNNNNNNNDQNNLNNQFSPKSESEIVIDNLKTCMYLLFILAFLRIFSQQYLWMFNDLLSALMVFCTFNSKTKFMAIFLLITGIMGMLYEFTLSSTELARISKQISD